MTFFDIEECTENYFIENDFIENPIDLFEHTYSNDILEFYYDLKDRIPYFITNMQFSHLMNFIINAKFNLQNKHNSYKANFSLILFEEEYNLEIKNLLYVLNNFLNSFFKKFTINYNDWLFFCYNHTDW